jgi:hypothetical protein
MCLSSRVACYILALALAPPHIRNLGREEQKQEDE